MATLEELSQRLQLAARLLAGSMDDIRDLSVGDTKANIRAIGEALTSIFEVQHAIFALRPELEPTFLKEVSPHSDANKRLTPVLAEAYRLVDKNNASEAMRLLEVFAASESSELHKGIALGEARRIAQSEVDDA